MQNQTKMKYAWDITTQQHFDEEELRAVNTISEMISGGFDVSDLKKQLGKIKKNLGKSSFAMV